MSVPLKSSPPHARTETVIIIERGEGEGIESEPVRLVRYLYTLEGELLGRLDAMDYEQDDQAKWHF